MSIGQDKSEVRMRSKVLRGVVSRDDYELYRAALEWDLADPIVIESRADLKSEKRWKGRVEPYNHQVSNLITFCRRLPVTLLADDVGLGKTISAGLIASELIARARLSKILIVAPKLLGPQWKEELESKFDIDAQVAVGRDLISAEPKEVGAVITTYHSARSHLESIPMDRFQMLILDEAHKLRNLYGTDEPPQVAKRFKKALEDRRFRFVLMLTATPIQNRLWDLYSLVDLLTAARGHVNPFGSEGMFVRKFIADGRDEARQLKLQARDEFRSIVYGYMSRVRRGDAQLVFPDRVVQMHKVLPSADELELIRVIARPIQALNRLAQISILQALASSPDALNAQLANMARNGTVPASLARDVQTIVRSMPPSAKLQGLASLIEKLKQEKPDRWRLVIFTGRLETQTTIQSFLEARGLKVGIINGMSGAKNQDTIARFKKTPPDCHVIVSTEAGSEGVNLQVANVLVNYDLPWNPMIVEQRIGRIQRLASEHASVGIFNIMLAGTFEEYIVGRLMEKLQMASHAIGDIESLLEASGMGDDEGGVKGFEEKVRSLVIAALAGQDVELVTRQAERSIAEAKSRLEKEEGAINDMLGSMEGADQAGPRSPKLPPVTRSIPYDEFVVKAFKSFGASVSEEPDGTLWIKEERRQEHIRFDESLSRGTLYNPGSATFSRLVSRVVASGVHHVNDADVDLEVRCRQLAHNWALSFNGNLVDQSIENVDLAFSGEAVARVRATVAHDSYERLVEIKCSPSQHSRRLGRRTINTLRPVIEDVSELGINSDALLDTINSDPGISEFCRFYLERRDLEVRAAGADERKRKKLEDEFTPRLEVTVVAAQGAIHRKIETRVTYEIDGSNRYSDMLTVVPQSLEITSKPALGRCSVSDRSVPMTSLGKCDFSGDTALKHLLVKSDLSSRLALPAHTAVCSVSQKRILIDEGVHSDISGNFVATTFVKQSKISGKKAENDRFSVCDFTNVDALEDELGNSEVSGKRFRLDEKLESAVSGRAGHKSEFLYCFETRVPICPDEAERCEVSGKKVRLGILRECAVTKKKVLPAELVRCAVSGQQALKNLFVTSSISGVHILETIAVRSAYGHYCSEHEARACTWDGQKYHPQDIKTCNLTSLPMHFSHLSVDIRPHLGSLMDLLAGVRRTAHVSEQWPFIEERLSMAIGKGKPKVEFATLSPDGRHIAICAEVRSMLGLKSRHVGAVYALAEGAIIGRIATGKRTRQGWANE